jgi:hypothetical protein
MTGGEWGAEVVVEDGSREDWEGAARGAAQRLSGGIMRPSQKRIRLRGVFDSDDVDLANDMQALEKERVLLAVWWQQLLPRVTLGEEKKE